MQNIPIEIAGQIIKPGTRTCVTLPSASLYTQSNMDIPVHVFHGKKAGPKVFIIGTIHGDELNSIEIIRRVHHHSVLKHLHGTLITIPVANIFGFILQSRYLPDRRDLNRAFPGSKSGSLAARLADILINEVVVKCNYGIDLHTGAIGRINMPQLRVNLETPGARDLALAFDAPVIIDAKIRDGSLREAASELGIPLLVYEGGEALRFNELCIRMGVRGILKVLTLLGMIAKPKSSKRKKYEPVITETSRWARAPGSGLVQPIVDLAQAVQKDDPLGYIHDPFLMNKTITVKAPFGGIVIGKTNLPLVNEGDAMYHIASFEEIEKVSAFIEDLQNQVDDAIDPLNDN
ncbi:succinylglutamate desuccinylase / aspartoacylase family protein [Legionella moravica]|uniref:Succinylglutamate desuccinylase / aspartoacylase family n=1 Tax=Legionella moravica TaxID=39962 RepID=A0A378K079_9GAMM|nr:succinylglutamate desuccinylase/aspartoacylase family protein [Legionella moravica]KTD38327.1 succinylglutamate desuccinylase / aspartoacylase family protein [Legionella moravica]STX63680.1 succinylglutamate desuccinylase / aspartoacylase family [Legionella moravica]